MVCLSLRSVCHLHPSCGVGGQQGVFNGRHENRFKVGGPFDVPVSPRQPRGQAGVDRFSQVCVASVVAAAGKSRKGNPHPAPRVVVASSSSSLKDAGTGLSVGGVVQRCCFDVERCRTRGAGCDGGGLPPHGVARNPDAESPVDERKHRVGGGAPFVYFVIFRAIAAAAAVSGPVDGL